MPQGNASEYPILPISLSIMLLCFLISLLISTLVDYLYDFYLVKLSKTDQKTMIESRVKSDIKRLREFFRSQKLEKFEPDQVKNRLTIVTSLLMEKVNSKENKALLIQNIPKDDKKEPKKVEKKVEELKKEDVKETTANKPAVKKENKPLPNKPQKTETPKIEKKVIIVENKKEIKEERNTETPKIEKKVVIVENKKEINEEKESKEVPKVIIKPEQAPTPIPKVSEIQKPKPAIRLETPTPIVKTSEETKPKPMVEGRGERVILAQETTIEEVIKKLSLAPRSATVFIEIRENKVRESSPKPQKGPVIKFSPPSTIEKDNKSVVTESELKFSNDEASISFDSHQKVQDYKKNINSNHPKQNGDLIELLNRKTSFNQNLTKTFRDNQSKMIQERLKLDADFRRTRHTPPVRSKTEYHNRAFKYDNDEEDESFGSVKKQVFE